MACCIVNDACLGTTLLAFEYRIGGGGIHAASLGGSGRGPEATGRWGNDDNAKPSRVGVVLAPACNLSSPTSESALNDSIKLRARFSSALSFLFLIMAGDLFSSPKNCIYIKGEGENTRERQRAPVEDNKGWVGGENKGY